MYCSRIVSFVGSLRTNAFASERLDASVLYLSPVFVKVVGTVKTSTCLSSIIEIGQRLQKYLKVGLG